MSEGSLEEVANEKALKTERNMISTCHCCQSALGTREACVTSDVRASRD